MKPSLTRTDRERTWLPRPADWLASLPRRPERQLHSAPASLSNHVREGQRTAGGAATDSHRRSDSPVLHRGRSTSVGVLSAPASSPGEHGIRCGYWPRVSSVPRGPQKLQLLVRARRESGLPSRHRPQIMRGTIGTVPTPQRPPPPPRAASPVLLPTWWSRIPSLTADLPVKLAQRLPAGQCFLQGLARSND
jgi:hypothetical protein